MKVGEGTTIRAAKIAFGITSWCLKDSTDCSFVKLFKLVIHTIRKHYEMWMRQSIR